MHRADQPDRPARVLGYARVSTGEQGEHGSSLEVQQEELTRHCAERGWPKPELHVEIQSGGAGAEEARVEQRRLMASVRSGDLVLVCKQDRWSRHTLHFIKSTEEIVRVGARFLSIAERFDPSTSEGRFASTIMAAVAQQERDRILDRTLGGRRRLRSQGHHVEGRAPIGYNIVNRKLVPSNDAPLVQRMFQLACEGKSLREIELELQAHFPNKPYQIRHFTIWRRLKDRQYMGVSATKAGGDEWIPTHEALVDAPTWHLAQQQISGRAREGGRPKGLDSPTAPFLLRGIGRCASCGYTLRSSVATDSSRPDHGGYYSCATRLGAYRLIRKPCPHGPIAKRLLVDEMVNEQVFERLKLLVGRLSKPTVQVTVDETPNFDAERAKLVKSLGRVVDAVADGALPKEAAKKKTMELEAAIALLDAKRLATEAEQRAAVKPDRGDLLKQMKHLQTAWNRMPVPAKQEVLGMLAERVELQGFPSLRASGRNAPWKLEITWRKLS